MELTVTNPMLPNQSKSIREMVWTVILVSISFCKLFRRAEVIFVFVLYCSWICFIEQRILFPTCFIVLLTIILF